MICSNPLYVYIHIYIMNREVFLSVTLEYLCSNHQPFMDLKISNQCHYQLIQTSIYNTVTGWGVNKKIFSIQRVPTPTRNERGF